MASVLFAVMTVTMNLIEPPKLKRMSLIVYKSGNSSRYTSLLLHSELATNSHVAFSSPFCVLHKRCLWKTAAWKRNICTPREHTGRHGQRWSTGMLSGSICNVNEMSCGMTSCKYTTTVSLVWSFLKDLKNSCFWELVKDVLPDEYDIYSCFINPWNPKIKIWILICCPHSFPTEVVGRSW